MSISETRNLKRYELDEENRKTQRELRIEQLLADLVKDDSRWGAYYLSPWQLLSTLMIFSISVGLYVVNAKNLRGVDSNFLLSIFGALLTIGTFLPAFLASVFEKKFSSISTKVFWQGIPRTLTLAYVTLWTLTLYLVSSTAIFARNETPDFALNKSALLLSLSFSTISLIPILLWVLFSRFQPMHYGRVSEIFVSNLIRKREEAVLQSYIQSYLRSVLGSMSQSHNEDLQERLTRISRLATLQNRKTAESILDGLGWLAQTNIKDREIVLHIIDQIYALTQIKWQDPENEYAIRRKATQELWSIFEYVLTEKASRMIIQEIMEVLTLLLQTARDNEISAFFRRYAEVARLNPSMAGFVQRYTFAWFDKYAEHLLLSNKRNIDIYLDYLLNNYDWKNAEKDSRSPDFGLKQAFEDFDKVLRKAKKFKNLPKNRMTMLRKIQRAIGIALKSKS